MKKKKQWTKEHLLWDNKKWPKVIYNDKSEIELNSNVREYIQRPIQNVQQIQ